MRTETHVVKIYTFDELPENIKQKAIEKLWDINVDYEWWEFIYEDAANVGIKITGFDTGRGNDITGDFIWYAIDVCKAILLEHGKNTETYKTASTFLPELKKEWEEDYGGEEAAEEFKRAILEDYLAMLRSEYEYFTSEERIIETIQANEYEFTEDGEIYP